MARTGPSDGTRQAVMMRAGLRCEVCSGPLISMSIHHRIPRQMGGTKAPWINSPENLLAICGSGTTGCHGYIEANRDESYETGRLVRRGMLPWEIPFMDLHQKWWFLHAEEKYPLTLPFNIPSSL